ncbi:uncharacterized protein CIMG_00486 [Coccidioides immitis RS]|uniref:DASH complex subunit SPC34 n=2 Tax=Coccidioides immitis TaxID=5501 RepID=A0A0E1RY89_COCIM|nr:uncharacterized protein CIMG_00486 [Coccidioides immitis RS]EAS35132.1 hypothetical protein CIMG_00486 [Coccidioides immitis RS]KMU76834.1 hypothetical protein CISG_05667 [Coccidioides immitis RMSCC 3703]TPX26588.1 hypothetical protein DIZ76_012050 [Coccidioides immitis]
MSTLLHNHLEQISLSATSIAELPFPPPKMFANALLGPHDITTLIRDTEAHERALFSADPSTNSTKHRRATRRGTMFPTEGEKETMVSRIHSAKNHRNQSAVARVLGGDMMEAIRKSANAPSHRTNRGEMNIEILLRGAEMLCKVYPVAGAKEKIASLRQRYQEVSESVARLEERVSYQTEQLEQMNLSGSYRSDYYDTQQPEPVQQHTADITDEDIERELGEIRELELRKRTLENRVSGMERDLGGLLR